MHAGACRLAADLNGTFNSEALFRDVGRLQRKGKDCVMRVGFRQARMPTEDLGSTIHSSLAAATALRPSRVSPAQTQRFPTPPHFDPSHTAAPLPCVSSERRRSLCGGVVTESRYHRCKDTNIPAPAPAPLRSHAFTLLPLLLFFLLPAMCPCPAAGCAARLRRP